MHRQWLLVVLLWLPFATQAEEEAAEAKLTGSFFAVVVSDVEASRNWYQTVLGLEEVSRNTERGRYDIINLSGPGLFVELLQLDAAGKRPGGQTEGPFKVGLLVDDLTAFAAALPSVAEGAEIIYDRKNNVLILQLRDPDNNTVQVMQVLED